MHPNSVLAGKSSEIKKLFLPSRGHPEPEGSEGEEMKREKGRQERPLTCKQTISRQGDNCCDSSGYCVLAQRRGTEPRMAGEKFP